MKPLPFYETGPALAELCHVIRVASGAEEADLVLKNLRYLNVFTVYFDRFLFIISYYHHIVAVCG